MENWVSDGGTVNQHYYRKVLETSGEKKTRERGHNCEKLVSSFMRKTLSEAVFGPEMHYST